MSPAPRSGRPRAVVVYESMFGNTHVVAEAVGRGLGANHDVEVVAVHGADATVLAGVELLVVGGPTHAHSVSTSRSRARALELAAAPGATLELDPDAEGEGLRSWFHHLPDLRGVRAAAFDTRISTVSERMSGRASTGIDRRLRRHGLRVVAPAQSFSVDEQHRLADGELDRARAWGGVLSVTR